MDVLNVALPAVLGAETEPAALDILGVSCLTKTITYVFMNFDSLLYNYYLSCTILIYRQVQL